MRILEDDEVQIRKDYEMMLKEHTILMHVIWVLVRRLGNKVVIEGTEPLVTADQWELVTIKDPLTSNIILEAKDRKKE